MTLVFAVNLEGSVRWLRSDLQSLQQRRTHVVPENILTRSVVEVACLTSDSTSREMLEKLTNPFRRNTGSLR